MAATNIGVGMEQWAGSVRNAKPNSMKLKNTVKRLTLPPESIYPGRVKSVTAKGDAKCVIEFEFSVGAHAHTASKTYPAKFECGAPLVDDAETIVGQSLDCDKAGAEFDTDLLIGKPCQIVVEHKRTSGGRIVAAVETVLPPVTNEVAAK